MKLKYRDLHIIKSTDDSLVLDLDQSTLTMSKHSGAGGDYGTTEEEGI